MAILAVAADLADLRSRLGRIVVAYTRDGGPVTTADLEVDGAMTAIMARAINPNLMQTVEGQPVLVHAGPFANIAIGQSSIIADRVGLKLADYHVTESGFGARELAEAVAAACDEPADFRYLYPDTLPLRERIERITTEVYGGAGVTYAPAARARLTELEEDPALAGFGTCMVKTHLSLSHDPALKGRPTGWELPIRDILLYHGAGLAVPVAGDIKLMPGAASDPAFRRIDVDTATGRITGLH